ncbi:protein Atu4866 [Pseudomonas punonensis]|uniref:Protein Atu4866 n=2 Tax=Phytopseudomonas punonensis TaxID=1220495 RepID=A0A1M7F9D5_9GAMM|nr:protein Atu4866 [Pseudomonas punonensis]
MTVAARKKTITCSAGALLLGALQLLTPTTALASSQAATSSKTQQEERQMTVHPYVGMWVTDDGQIRHELLPDNRYDEARGTRESAYQGRYEVNGTHIDYWDDTGFTADGEFVDRNTLHHGGMIFRRR